MNHSVNKTEMAITKNAYLRYRILDRCFRDTSRKYGFDDLLNDVNKSLADADMEAPGIEVRQLRKDLQYFRSMEGYDAPLETVKEGRFSYYTYSDKNFSISNQPLQDNEAEQLKAALEMLGRFDGAPQFEWLAETISMLSQRFDLTKQSRKAMGFESNIYYAGYKFIAPFFNAIVNKRVLHLGYQPYGADVINFEFHPSYLKQYNNRWFAFGYNPDAEEKLAHIADIWNLALDRVVSIKEIPKEYRENDMDWEEDFFSEIIGVSRRDEEIQEVVLRFTKEQAPYIITKPIHQSQRPPIENPDGSVSVRLKVVPNFELEQVILSFGEKVTVEQPEKLRQKIKDRLSGALKNY